MDFSLSEQQTSLQDGVRRFCRDGYDLRARQRILNSPEGYDSQNWTLFAQLGWLGAALPEEAGGYAESMIEASIILEEFGTALVLEPYLPCALLSAQALWLCGGTARHQALLSSMVKGTLILALAHAEAGLDPLRTSVETTARPLPGGGHVLVGSKSLVLGGSQAQSFLVSARTSGVSGDMDGVSLFLVDKLTPGVQLRRYRTLDGAGAADLRLEGVRVDSDALIGREGESLSPLERAIDCAIVGLCAESVGCMGRVLSTTTDYLKTRRAYGTTLSSFQALQHDLAQMLVELELSRSALHSALAAFCGDDFDRRRRAASTAKAVIGRAGLFVGSRGIQLHGAMGMVDDYIIGQMFKRLTVAEALFGNSDFHLERRFCR